LSWAARLGTLGRRPGILCVALAAALALAASATGGSPTHAAFVAQANALCRSAQAQTATLKTPTTAPQAAAYLRKVIPAVEHLRSATLALPAPKADRPAIIAGMANLAKELAFLGAAEGAAKAGNVKAYRAAMTAAHAANTAGTAYARKLGLTAWG
jgi:hypothetical protein